MYRKVLPLFIVTVLISSRLPGQITIHGRVTDAKKGYPLSYANIQITGTYLGTITNSEGEYVISLPNVPTTLRFSYIGYLTENIEITEQSTPRQDVEMEPTIIELQPVVVTGENPAVSIMRKVIKKKREWLDRLNTYSAKAYTRAVVANDTMIVSIAESTSDLFWDKKRGTREVVTSRRETANITTDQNFAFAGVLPNLYDDDIDIIGFTLVGPTHPDALKYYDFSLIGQRYLDDKLVADISIAPHGKLQPTFIGQISVLLDDYIMIDVDVKPNDAILFPPPLQEVNLHFRQQFSDFGRDFWLPVDVRIQGEIRLGFTGLQFPTIHYSQVSRLSDYTPNAILPDSLFKSHTPFQVDSLTMARDTLLAGETQMVPLTAEEEKAYTNPDSTLTLETAFRPTGPLARFMRIEAEGEGRSVESPGPEGHSGPLSGLSPKLYYDRVDGLGAGLTLSRQITRRLRLELSGDYRTGLKRWGGTAALQYEGSGRSALRGDFNLFTESALRQDSFNYPRIFNSLAVLIGAADYYDYYWREGFSLRIGRGFHPGLPVRLTLGINAETHSSLAKTTDWSLFKRDIVFRDNPAVAAGRIRALTATLELGEELPPWGIVGARHVEVQLEHSSPDFLSSDFDYTTIRLILDGRLSTFLRRRFLPNVLDFRLVAGTSYGSPPLQKLCSMDTRLGLFAPFGTFRTLANRPLEGDRYLGIFWEHNFRTVPFELLGLRKLARMGYSIILHGASGRTWMEQDAALAGSVFTLRDWHHEVGISLSGILDFLRLDVTTEIGGKGLFFSFGMARLF